jgi:hypothetical protein
VDRPRSGLGLSSVPSLVRWIAVWVLIALWLIALAFDVGGNLAHLLLLGAIVLLVYELLSVPASDEEA